MSRKLFFRILFLATLVSILVALPALAESNSSGALRPLIQTTPEPGALQAQPAFRADLSGEAVTPPVATNASGEAVFILVDEAGSLALYYKVMVAAGIEEITAAYIREGEPGEDGPIVFTLFDGTGTFDPENPLSGSVTLSNAQVTELLVGNYYVEVETNAHPEGEIRGQILPFTPPARFRAPLTGEAEVPPVETEASGLATFILNSSLDSLQYTVAVRSIAGISEAHIYTGQPGETGTILWTLFDGTGTFDPDNPISGDLPLTPEELLELLTGNLHVNVLTTEHPEGEIRGQIGSGSLAFEAILSGADEVPRVATSASGRAVMVLKEDLTTLLFHVAVADISNVTAAHIHDGLPGENGPILFDLFTGSGTFDPGNPVTGSLTLTEEQVIELVAGNFYVNVHTEANPGGEIRGQLHLLASETLNAVLTGRDEVPPVMTDAASAARFTLSEEMNSLHYEIAVVNIEDITAAHLHPGFRGEEGPPEITIYSPTDPRDFDPENPLSGDASLTAEQLLDLLVGGYYLNIHTSAYPEGEIRGQVESGFHVFEAQLAGANAVPPVSTEASGRAVFVLGDDLRTLYYRVVVSDIADITA
ncbi:MAG TPA: CHRD domain-containing protein, partial [Anaerolineales bacterium]